MSTKTPDSSHRDMLIFRFLSSEAFQKKSFLRVLAEFTVSPGSLFLSWLAFRHDDDPEKRGIGDEEQWHILVPVVCVVAAGLVSFTYGPCFFKSIPQFGAGLDSLAFTILLSLITNVPTLYVLRVLSSSAQGRLLLAVTEGLPDVVRITEEATASVKEARDGVNKILGHKIWAEDKTHSLLENLIQAGAGERAKWHIVKFLSILADQHVENGSEKGFFKISTDTDGTWHIWQYSKFLADNIDHASREIVWLVDPNDFCRELIPSCLDYALSSACAVRFKDQMPPAMTLWNDEDGFGYDNAFGLIMQACCPQYETREVASAYLAKLIEEHEKSRGNNHTTDHSVARKGVIQIKPEKPIGWWYDATEIVLRGFAYFGELVLKKDGYMDPEQIQRGFKCIYDDWVRHTLPHIDALERSKVLARRRLLLPSAGCPDEAFEIMGVSLLEKIKNNSVLATGIATDSNAVLRAADSALRLFGRLNGKNDGIDRIEVHLFKTEEGTPSLSGFDAGLYDSRFLVCATGADSPKKRMVNWYFLLNDSPALNDSRAEAALRVLRGHGTEPLSKAVLRSSYAIAVADASSEYDAFCRIMLSVIRKKLDSE